MAETIKISVKDSRESSAEVNEIQLWSGDEMVLRMPIVAHCLNLAELAALVVFSNNCQVYFELHINGKKFPE